MAGADVGGFAASPQPDLLTRWLEVAAFQPIDRDHAANGTRPQEPWENGTPEDVSLRRRYIEERYRLLPYLYTIAEEMSRTGLPIVRPLFLEFPNGTGRWPATRSGQQRFVPSRPRPARRPEPFPDEMDDYTVALPPTGWYDYWTGSRVSGSSGRKGIDNAPVAQSEVHIQRGPRHSSGLCSRRRHRPQQPLVQSTDEKPEGPLTLRVYPPIGVRTSDAVAASTLTTE